MESFEETIERIERRTRKYAHYVMIALTASGGRQTRLELAATIRNAINWPLTRGEMSDALHYLRGKGAVNVTPGESGYFDSSDAIVERVGR